MAKPGGNLQDEVKIPRTILITQPRPESPKSPYFELERKYNLTLEFKPFITLQGLDAKEFRKQRIEIFNYTGVIFTSKNAIDHFFRICEEMKIAIGGDTKYFCITEAVALYLQKFILYRKRKVFYGSDGSNKSMFDVINKHKENEKFIYPCSENQQDGEIVNWLKTNNCEYVNAFMYRTVSADVKEILKKYNFDIMCFFTPSGVKSLLENIPKYKQNGTLIGAFGNNTSKAIEDAGLKLTIKAPLPEAPSMIAALDKYLASVSKKK
jgi:uroporphyrinogen-III synthase